MGGNALSVTTCQLNDRNYHRLSNQIIEQIKEVYNKRIGLIPSYLNKADFGDMDILIESSPEYNPYHISKFLNATEVVTNGSCTSIGIKLDHGIFQVDLIKVKPEDFSFALGYFSYNDLGNLIGRISHKFGFKFGHQGLLYILRDKENKTNVIKEIVVTKNFSEALRFLGFNPNAYYSGTFLEIKDVFEYVINSPYFSPSIYLWDNLNHTQRVRDKKRKTYNQFVRYIQQFDPKNYFDYTNIDQSN